MNPKCTALIAISFALLPADAARATGPSVAARQPTVTDAPLAARQLLDLVNRERAAAGLVPFAARDDVAAIAAPWTRRMAADGWLSHNDSYLSVPTMQRLGATGVGENVAFADSLIEVHQALMASPRHRENILNAEFRQVGIAAVHSAGEKLYVTEDFLTPRVRPSVPPAARPSPPPSRALHAAPRPRDRSTARPGVRGRRQPRRR